MVGYMQNIINAFNGNKTIIGGILTIIFTSFLPLVGVHITTFSVDDVMTWIPNILEWVGQVLFVIGMIHKVFKKETSVVALLQAFFGKKVIAAQK
jgi:hypothetical protein